MIEEGESKLTFKSIAPTSPYTIPPFAVLQTPARVIYGNLFINRINNITPLNLFNAIDLKVNLDSPSSIIITFSQVVSDSDSFRSVIAKFISDYAASLNMALDPSRVTVTISTEIATLVISDSPFSPSGPTPTSPIPIPSNPTPTTPPSWHETIHYLSINTWGYHTIPVMNNSVGMNIIFSILSTQNAIIDIYLLYDPIIDGPVVNITNYSCKRLGLSSVSGYWMFDWNQDKLSSMCSKLDRSLLTTPLKGRMLLGIFAKTEVVYQIDDFFIPQSSLSPPYVETIDSPTSTGFTLVPSVLLILLIIISLFHMGVINTK